MQVKVFKFDKNGRISFTQAELERLLNEVYNGGFNDGKKTYWTWTSPYWSWTSTTASNANSTLTGNATTISAPDYKPTITFTTANSTNSGEKTVTMNTYDATTGVVNID